MFKLRLTRPLRKPLQRVFLLCALLGLAATAQARESLLVDSLPPELQLRDVSAAVNDVLARNRWRILPGTPARIHAQFQDQRTICRVAIQLRSAALYLEDDCRQPGVAGNWIDTAERRAIPEAWLRPLRQELRVRYPRPTLPPPGSS